jgi:hypothetical protein
MKRLMLIIGCSFPVIHTLAQNVGIGTTTPATRLHVSGTSANIATFNGGSSMWLTLAENDIERGYIGSFTGNAEDVDFGTYGSNATGKVHLTTGNSPRLSVIPSGDIGIGTTSPESRLHIRTTNWIKTIFENDAGQPRGYIGSDNNGTLTLSSNAYWNGSAWVYPNTGNSLYLLLHQPNEAFEFRVRPDGGSQSTVMVVKVDGNVGIGTTSPQQQLSVSAGAVIDQGNNNTGSITNTLRFGSNSGEAIGSKRNSGTGQFGLDFYTGNQQRMTIANNGNVGIGTNNPTAKLDINGDVKIQNRILLNNVAGNAGQALVSNGNASSPTWQNIAYSNNDRFYYTVASGQTGTSNTYSGAILYNTVYANSSAISYNSSNGTFTVNKSGLYSINADFIPYTGKTIENPAIICTLLFTFGGVTEIFNSSGLDYAGVLALGHTYMSSIRKKWEIYLSVGVQFTFSIYLLTNNQNSSGLQSGSGLSINLISE